MPTKNCEQCGASFDKPVTCSMHDWTTRRRFCSYLCKAANQLGQKPWNKGTKGLQQAWNKGVTGYPTIFCAVCGKPTGRSDPRNKTCGQESCKAAYRATAGANISAATKATYQSGRKAPGIFGPSVSMYEAMIAPRLLPLGWVSQFNILTGDESKFYRVDFALLRRKLYIEIDGSIHTRMNRPAHDAKRTRTLALLGWHGMRFTNEQVAHDMESVVGYVIASCHSGRP